MRRLLALGVVALAFGSSMPASALICADDPSLTPARILEGSLMAGDKRYDLAMVARVRQSELEEDRQVVAVDVLAIYGRPSAPDSEVVVFDQAGTSDGWPKPLVVGRGYFLPVVFFEGAYHVHICDPVHELASPDEGAVELAGVAATSGLEYWLPAESPPPGGRALAYVVVLGGLAGLLVWTFVRRRGDRPVVSGTGSDPRRQPPPHR